MSGVKNMRFFLDFDGTIATADVIDMVLERYAGNEWRRIEKEWAEGRIGSRECLTRQIALVKADWFDIKSLLHEVRLDPYFEEFLKMTRALSVPVAVVSDGFDLFIREILSQKLNPMYLEGLPVYCNKIKWEDRGLRTFFEEKAVCEHGCANCKPAVIREVKKENESVVFVGDGLSDRFAAKVSDSVFAKSKLAHYCRENGIAHQEFESFKDICRWLAKEADSRTLFIKNAGAKARV